MGIVKLFPGDKNFKRSKMQSRNAQVFVVPEDSSRASYDDAECVYYICVHSWNTMVGDSEGWWW